MMKSLIGGSLVHYQIIIFQILDLYWGQCLVHQNKWLTTNLLNKSRRTIIAIALINKVDDIFIWLNVISTACAQGSNCGGCIIML